MRKTHIQVCIFVSVCALCLFAYNSLRGPVVAVKVALNVRDARATTEILRQVRTIMMIAMTRATKLNAKLVRFRIYN